MAVAVLLSNALEAVKARLREEQQAPMGRSPMALRARSLGRLCREYEALNREQRLAVAAAMSARDYALVVGMPGTGKTATIAFVARAMVAMGKSVLISAYTNTAVDNLLLKILDSETVSAAGGGAGRCGSTTDGWKTAARPQSAQPVDPPPLPHTHPLRNV